MLFLEQIPNDLRLLLAAMEMAAQAGDHLRLVGRSTLAQGVGLDVLVEQLVGVQFGAVAGQPDQAQSLGVFSDELLRRRRPIRWSCPSRVGLSSGGAPSSTRCSPTGTT